MGSASQRSFWVLVAASLASACTDVRVGGLDGDSADAAGDGSSSACAQSVINMQVHAAAPDPDAGSARLSAVCLPRAPVTRTTSTGARRIECRALTMLPAGQTCDASRGMSPARDASGEPITLRDDTGLRAVCEVAQRAVHTDGTREPGIGYWYVGLPASSDPNCVHPVELDPDLVRTGTFDMRLECVMFETAGCAR